MKRRNIVNKAIKYLREITVSGSQYRYGVFYGFVALIMIIAKQVFSLISYDSDTISSLTSYITVFAICGVLLISFLIIYIMKLKESNLFAKTFISIFPFLLVILGVIISNLYIDNHYMVLSMTVLIIMVTWVQIYPPMKRLLLYVSVIVFHYLYDIIFNGIGSISLNDSSYVIMLSIMAFFTSTIFYQLYMHNKFAIDDLNKNNNDIKKVISDLEISHDDLRRSKEITYALFEMTQEVLENEKIENLMQLILEKAIDFIPSGEAGSILVVDRNANKMRFVAAVGYKLRNLQKVQLSPEELFQAKFDDMYQPAVIKNLETFDEAHIGKEKTDQLKVEAATIAKSCLTCSFKYNGEFFGSINIDNFDSEDIFTNKDKDLIKQFSSEIEIIISIHKLYQQALRPTKYDDLTGAKTRKYTMRLLENLTKRTVEDVISICVIDINDLKKVNDKYGHDIGDKFLNYYSETIINLNIRDNIFGRIGGDEFVIIFDKTNKLEAYEEIKKIRDNFGKQPFKFGDNEIEVTFSVGVSEYPFDSENISELIKLSDKRMYNDKNIQKHLK